MNEQEREAFDAAWEKRITNLPNKHWEPIRDICWLFWQDARAAKPAAEPYGYVTTLRTGMQYFYKNRPYLDNAVSCDTVYTAPQPAAPEQQS